MKYSIAIKLVDSVNIHSLIYLFNKQGEHKVILQLQSYIAPTL